MIAVFRIDALSRTQSACDFDRIKWHHDNGQMTADEPKIGAVLECQVCLATVHNV